jgi:hypothetical protein
MLRSLLAGEAGPVCAVAHRDLGFDYVGTCLQGCAHRTVGRPLRKEGDPAAIPGVHLFAVPQNQRNEPL